MEICNDPEFADSCTTQDCVNGFRVPPALCACDSGWTGRQCDEGKHAGSEAQAWEFVYTDKKTGELYYASGHVAMETLGIDNSGGVI